MTLPETLYEMCVEGPNLPGKNSDGATALPDTTAEAKPICGLSDCYGVRKICLDDRIML